MKVLARLSHIFDHIIDVFAVVAAVIMLFLVVSICTDITLRYFFNRPLIWVLQVSQAILLYIPFLGAAWVLRRKGHVRVDNVVGQLGPRTQVVFSIIGSIIGAAICLILAWYGALEAWNDLAKGLYLSEPPSLPSGPIIAIIPIGSFLFFVQFLRDTYKHFGELKAPPRQQKEIQG